MLRIGCDFHPGFPQVAIFDKERGEISCRRLQHPEEARAFYGLLPEPALVGVEACVRTIRKGIMRSRLLLRPLTLRRQSSATTCQKAARAPAATCQYPQS